MALPLRLGVEPLADVVFEVRFKSQLPTASLLPGLLFSALVGDKKLDRLPAAEIPAPIRSTNPDMRYAPILRMDWRAFYVNIGDFNVGVCCKMPYPGWKEFRPAILEVLRVCLDADIPQAVERCAFKSTDIIERKFGLPKEVVALSLQIGGRDLRDTLFQVRSEIPEGNLVHVVQVAAEGTMQLPDGKQRSGTVLDIDTIYNLGDLSKDDFRKMLPDALELVHDKNKEMFFSCLAPDLLPKLEPVYG